MGADIHAYIEYRNPYGGKSFSPLGGQLYLPRDYIMFGLMAGVRTHPENASKAKGIPDDLGWESLDDYYLRVVDDYDSESGYSNPGYCSPERAEKYVRENGSIWREGYGPDSKYPQLTNPDWHSASWMTTRELNNVFHAYISETRKIESIVWADGGIFPDPAWRAALAAMKELPEPRLVFWFDN